MAALGTVITAMVTPFDEDGRVDQEAAVGLMRHLVEHGSDGVVICGTTGEASTLSDEEHMGLVELAVGELGDRAAVIAGTGSNDTAHAVHLTERATELGVDGVISVTPYYNRPPPRGIVRHFEEVARATDRPVVLYNIPSRTATNMGPDLLAQLAQIEHVEAVKQANDDELALIDGLDLYAGNDNTLARTLDLGGAGGILVSSHVVGEEMKRMVTEPERRAEIDAGLGDVYETLFMTANPICVKAALNLLGIRVGGLRLPLVEASPDEVEAVRAMLERHGLLAAAPAS